MAKIKIISNPYARDIEFKKWDTEKEEWKAVSYTDNGNSQLISDTVKNSFFTFAIKEILDTVIEEYDDGKDIQVEFEGTDDEFQELFYLVQDKEYQGVAVKKTSYFLRNARDVLPKVIDIFNKTHELIPEVLQRDSDIEKFKDSSSDAIPLVILGNYSSGKSTFINALIGNDILPNSDRPITAKIFEIRKSDSLYSKVGFKVNGKTISISICDDNYAFSENKGGANPLQTVIEERFQQLTIKSADIILHMILDIINQYEFEESRFKISDLITLEVPFKKGILADSDKKYIIFDTPGSNSSSNQNHFEVLKTALKNMSNGLAVFVSEYTSLDTVDNEKLYEELRDVEAIDNRFTPIVINKADIAGLPKEGLSEIQIQQILNQAIPRNLYSEGIFFVSSIMGLGSKNNGQFIDSNYDRVFKKSSDEFSNDQSEYYQELYRYNIVPSQLSFRMKEAAESQTNQLIYANSGLFSVENEIEIFANKYSAYNKCQQARLYLEKIIEKTQTHISQLKQETEDKLQKLQNDLERNKKLLIEKVNLEKQNNDSLFEGDYQDKSNKEWKETNETITVECLTTLCDKYYQSAKKAFKVEAYRRVKEQASEKVKTNIYSVIEVKSLPAIKSKFKQVQDDIKEVNHKHNNFKNQQNQAFTQVSKKLIDDVNTAYQDDIMNLKEKIFRSSVSFWELCSEQLKENLAKTVGNTDGLPIEKRKDIQQLIFDYESIVFEKDQSQIFSKENFKLGIQIGDFTVFGNSNKLDLKKLSKKYKQLLKEDLEQMIADIMTHHVNNFKVWSNHLLQIIEQNIIEFSPNLQKTNSLIIDKNRQIEDYTLKLSQLKTYSLEIMNLLDWKTE